MPPVLFTSETARQAQRLSAIARRGVKMPRLKPHDGLADLYQTKRLVRVRRQQDLIDDRLEKELEKDELDAQLIDRLAAASMRLSDQEFALANRPKPANAKAPAQPRRQAPRPEPTPIEPSPSVVHNPTQGPVAGV